MNTAYVYAYLNPLKSGLYKYGDYEFCNEPYYIGMSANDPYRKFSHIYEAKDNINNYSYKLNKIRKLIRECGEETVINNIIIIADNLTREDAGDLEINLISLIGRKDLGTGPLTNLTMGGEGAVGMSVEACMKRAASILANRSPRSCYSYTPEESAESNSRSMIEFFYNNRNKTLDDLPELKYRRFYSRTTHGRSGTKNGMASFYYLVITDDGGYHLASKGCMKYLAEKLNIAATTIECSARDNERRSDGKFTRIMRGSGYGSFALRFSSISKCPIDITMGNQQPKPNLP